jgi:FAD/FMN-containing dehydrogenase
METLRLTPGTWFEEETGMSMGTDAELGRLRARVEAGRLRRLHQDDARSTIGREAAESLAQHLRREIEGEVRFDDGSRALYATDGSNYRQAPIGVVIPRNVQDVETTVRLARAYGAPVLSRGGGTSLAGQCCNVAVLIDFSKYMHQVLEIDADKRLARVQPGCVLDSLRKMATAQAQLTFGPDPSTHSRCTLGGMLGNNSCGSHSLLSQKHGFGLRTADNTKSLDVLLYDDVSVACGERVLLPEVRETTSEEIVIADGFSCQEQIEQGTGRHALHMAQVLDLATNGGIPARLPERAMVEERRKSVRASATRTGIVMGAAAVAFLLVRWWRRRG